MSLLATPVYSTQDTPLWVSVNGGTISGNTTFTGAVECDSVLRVASPLGLRLTAAPPNQVNIAGSLAPDVAGTNLYFTTNGTMYLGRNTAGTNANTTFTPSAPTTNGDVLAVGGRITTAPGGGITPISSPTALVNVTLGATVPLVPTTPIPIATGKWYDVQVSGYWTIPIGTAPAVGDKAEILVAVGAGVAPSFYNVSDTSEEYPGFVDDPWVAGSYRPFKIRARLQANANLASPIINATLSGTGLYPAGVDVEITALSIVALS